jgi:hypothetical protein
MPSRLVRPGLTRILKTYPLLCISYLSTPANRAPDFSFQSKQVREGSPRRHSPPPPLMGAYVR